MSRNCVDCQAEVSIRRKRCETCRKAHHAQVMRERRVGDAEVGSALPMASSVLVDYTRPGAASRPPDFSGIGKTPTRADELTDGSAPHPIDRVYQPDLSRLPNSKRRNRYEVEREWVREMIAAEAAEDEPSEMSSWEAVRARGERMANAVDFSRSSVDMSGLRGGRPQRQITNPAAAGMAFGPSPEYRAAAAGNSVRSVQPPPPYRGPQKTPHIVG